MKFMMYALCILHGSSLDGIFSQHNSSLSRRYINGGGGS